jgi:TupA-like ATPgrasp
MLYIPQPVRKWKRHLFRRAEGERILRGRFAQIHGSMLDLKNANTFTEKVYRRMIETNRDGIPTFTRLADKYLAREHVRETIGAEYLVPLIWSGEDPRQIPFDHLPPKSIAMTNHGSGGNIVLEHPIDRDLIIKKMHDGLSQNFYWAQREFQYYEIEPRVMVEEFIDDDHPDGPLDYRFWCFNGKAEAIQVDNNSHSLNAFYTTTWNLTDCTYRNTTGIRQAKRPDNLGELLSVAERLSSPFDFVRIDLYSVKGKTYFGEFTFTPTAGCNKFDPLHWDLYFGEKWL